MEYIYAFFYLFNEMAPYLLLGFLIAGLMHVYVPKKIYSQHLSKPSFKSVFLSALFGVPLPLCSCGVIPTAMSLHKEGASKGATISFLTATPQTGVDSIMATYSLLGLPFAIIRPVIAFVTGLLGGTLVNRLEKSEPIASHPEDSCSTTSLSSVQRLSIAFKYGFGELVEDIAKWLILGLVVAGCITVFVPDGFFAQFSSIPMLNMLLILCLSIPMYICATGSIPIAASLMLKGISPGSALVLLMAGPATNIASILVIGKVLGKKTLAIYLATIVISAIGWGLFIDAFLPASWFSSVLQAPSMEHGMVWWKLASSILLFILLLRVFILKAISSSTSKATIMEETNGKTYHVKGMTCHHCSGNLENHLRQLEGVDSVHVSLEQGTVVIEGAVSPQEVRRVVDSLGYIFVTS
ncbi:MAG: permease [Bacteroidaceae bacterium]|nr:permease [Bacteroidaceae bacterium]